MPSLVKATIAIFFIAGLTACTETQLAVYGAKQILGTDAGAGADPYKVGSPYQIAGIWYTPTEDPDYDEFGIASWYGPKFHGSLTANGETYDMDGMTAAHPTLPLPSWVRVTSLENGRSVVVRINDRGPFKKNRLIDLSRAAARELDMIGNGTAKVRVTIVQTGGPHGQVVRPALLESASGHINAPYRQAAKPTHPNETPDAIPAGNVIAMPLNPQSPPPAASPQPTTPSAGAMNAAPAIPHYIQVGAFQSNQSAQRLQSRMTQLFGGARIFSILQDGMTLHKVWVGPYRSLDTAASALASLQDTGYAGAHIIRMPDQTLAEGQAGTQQ